MPGLWLVGWLAPAHKKRLLHFQKCCEPVDDSLVAWTWPWQEHLHGRNGPVLQIGAGCETVTNKPLHAGATAGLPGSNPAPPRLPCALGKFASLQNGSDGSARLIGLLQVLTIAHPVKHPARYK